MSGRYLVQRKNGWVGRSWKWALLTYHSLPTSHKNWAFSAIGIDLEIDIISLTILSIVALCRVLFFVFVFPKGATLIGPSQFLKKKNIKHSSKWKHLGTFPLVIYVKVRLWPMHLSSNEGCLLALFYKGIVRTHFEWV